MEFVITPEDLKRSKVLQPGKYLTTITSVEEQQSKKSGNMMTVVKLSVKAHPTNPKCADGADSADVPIKEYYITENGIGFALPFLAAVSGKPLVAGATISTEGLKNAIGKNIFTIVKNDEYNGRIGNVAADFMPVV
jgi:hypothetical protein